MQKGKNVDIHLRRFNNLYCSHNSFHKSQECHATGNQLTIRLPCRTSLKYTTKLMKVNCRLWTNLLSLQKNRCISHSDYDYLVFTMHIFIICIPALALPN